MGIIKKIILYFKKRKEEKERKELYKKKLAELRKRDPFIYKNKQILVPYYKTLYLYTDKVYTV